MLIAGLKLALTTAKWLKIGRITTALGTCCLTAAPAIEQIKNKRK